jgi:hypothetical protein
MIMVNESDYKEKFHEIGNVKHNVLSKFVCGARYLSKVNEINECDSFFFTDDNDCHIGYFHFPSPDMNPMISDSPVTLYVIVVEKETSTVLVVDGSGKRDVQCISNYDELCKSLTRRVEKFPYAITEAVGAYFMETPIVCSGKMPHKTNKPTEECFALNILTWIWNPMPKMNAIRKLVSSAIIPESNVFVVFAGKNDDNYTLKTAEYWNGSKW